MAEKKHDNLVAKVVRAIQANERHATAKTKKRGEISGGGKKPWRQKGTGRARAGSNRSPLWRGGGVVFGPTGVQNFSVKVNKKERALALEAVKNAKKNVTVTLSAPKATKTKEAAEFLKKNDIAGKVLIIADLKTEQLATIKRVFKNIPETLVLAKGNENVVNILWADKIVEMSEAKTKEAPKKATAKEAK